MPQRANGGVLTVSSAGHYEQAVNGLLVQTDEQGDGNAENA